MPVGRGDVQDVINRLARSNKSGAPGVDLDVAVQLLRRDGCQLRDPVLARREGVGQFRRHGDDVMRRRSDRGFGLREGVGELGKPKAQRGGDLHGLDDASVPGARGFEMHAPDIPADDDAHSPLPRRAMPAGSN